MNKVTILGSGTSTGVPILGCRCSVCNSTDLRNQRFRSSALLQTAKGRNILIDATPDLRSQLLNSQIDRIDAAIITHDHADHSHGMDDLRPYCFKQNSPLPVYSNEETAGYLLKKFPYIFDRQRVFADRPILGGGIPRLDLEIIAPGTQHILEEDFEFFELTHGHTHTLALRHQKMAYVIDCQSIPKEVLKRLQEAKLELLILDCLRYEPHQTHLHLDLALEYVKFISPKSCALTHLGHEMDYNDLSSQIQKRGVERVFPAYDGQRFYYSNS